MSGMRPLNDYRRAIAARFTPVVAVASSTEVDAACAASGLSFGKSFFLFSWGGHTPRACA
jgi:hypothetical protein